MKKNYFMLAAFATALAFTACSNEEEMPVVNGGGSMELDPESVIEIAISNTGTGTTRTARPVASSEAWNNVNRVQLVFFDGTSTVDVDFVAKNVANYEVTTEGLIKFKDSAIGDAVVNPEAPGKHENQKATLQVKGLDGSKKYTIVAYGWNDDTFPYGTITGPESGKTYYKADNTTPSLSGFNVEEVFAGSTEATTVASTTESETQITTVVKFTTPVKVELTRQVAGMLAYLKNVPKFVGESEVRSVTVDVIGQSTGFYFPASLYGKETTVTNGDEFNGIGTTYASTSQLLKFTISENQASYYVDETGNKTEKQDGTEGFEIYDFTKDEEGTDKEEGKKFQSADNMTVPEDLVCADNTLIGGLFILPFSEHVGSGKQDATLVVNLRDENGTVLKFFNVKTNETITTPSGITNPSYFYDIRCNNFYSIGEKVKTDTDGEGGGNPDKPQSLISNNELTTIVCDQWKLVHDMTLE